MAHLASRVAIVAAILTGANGWVTKSQSVYGAQINEIQDLMKGLPVDRNIQSQLGFLWTYPASSDDETGLGGGITWSWDPQLCDLLTPKFRETIPFANLVGCHSYKAAIARAFDKWSANSRFIKFVDVTAECDKLGLNYGPPTDPEGREQTVGIGGGNNYPHKACPLAKIWITRIESATTRRELGVQPFSDLGDTLEGVTLDHTLTTRRLSEVAGGADAQGVAVAVATARSHARYTTSFRYTNGEEPHTLASDGTTKITGRNVIETYAGTFSINVEDICWYMDSDFCSKFHYLKIWAGGAENAEMMVNGLTLGLMALGLLVYLIVVFRVLCALSGNSGDGQKDVDEDGDGKLSCCERTKAALREIASWNPFILALFVVMIFCPPLLQSQIFEPCFKCHDFEATTLHEIGHFLGLGHPDNIPANMISNDWANVHGPGQNSYQEMISAGGRTNKTNCKALWEGVRNGTAPGAVIDTDRVDQGEEVQGYPFYPIVNAQMEHSTQHNPKACLYNDDLEALATLYPDCGATSLSVNVCHRVQLNLGLVRLMIYVLGPFIFGLAGVLLCVGCVHKFADDERQADLKRTKALEHQNRELKSQRKAAAKAAKKGTTTAKAADVSVEHSAV